MARWDPPFPFDAKRIRPADEKYWNRYGPTPKAFVSLATGRRLWGSRFGQTTSIRVAVRSVEKKKGEGGGRKTERTVQNLPPSPFPLPPYPLDRLLHERLDPAAMGLVFQPVKRQGLAAAAGTTPFGVLFLRSASSSLPRPSCSWRCCFGLGIEQRAAADRHAAGPRPVAPAGGDACCWAKGWPWPPWAVWWACRLGIGYAALLLAGTADLVAGRRGHAVPAALRDRRQPGDRRPQRAGRRRWP